MLALRLVTILVYNTCQPDCFAKTLARLRGHRTPVEVVYASSLLRRYSDIPEPVIEAAVLDPALPALPVIDGGGRRVTYERSVRAFLARAGHA
ncbi:MAG TPA: hypothetical protein VF420_01265 [Casimicrobiaceae bacterium]